MIAEAHGASLPTVRTQVQAAFGNLGVRRQAERPLTGAALGGVLSGLAPEPLLG